jgi:hypothetical protein
LSRDLRSEGGVPLRKSYRLRITPFHTPNSVRTLVAQRVLGIAAGYEDLNDHDALRSDVLWGAVIGKLETKRAQCAQLAGEGTLNRLAIIAVTGRIQVLRARN